MDTATTAPAATPSTVNTALAPTRRTAMTESDKFGAFARRILRAYARRVGDMDIEGLAGLVALRDEVDAAIEQAVADLHGNPYSWTEIGRTLGITRQAAQQRFTRKAAR